MRGSDLRMTTVARAAAIAAQLQEECSILIEHYRKKENFPPDVSDGPLVSVPPPSSQLDTRDKLWRLHSALEQCHSLLERAIAKEEEELGGEEKGEYENRRKTVKERLLFLLNHTRELLRAADGSSIFTPSLDGSELDDPATLFQLKWWVYRIFMEVKYWSQTAIAVLQELQSDTAKTPSKLSKRSARR
ncbi:hypothetical protein ATANTOWER_012802 [Ataeniobius toweri]|uniref:Ciliary neurotrophic factor n=2 Tax=Goodeidae TaxID=28758 RepID=A0ABU7A714_9TELE|nr:hypothetical protein [Ataeniobius toweri]